MKYEVLTGADAELARLRGEKLEFYRISKGVWEERPDSFGECNKDGTLYRIRPKPIEPPAPKMRNLRPDDIRAGCEFAALSVDDLIRYQWRSVASVRRDGVCLSDYGIVGYEELRADWLIRYPGTWEWVLCEKEVEQ